MIEKELKEIFNTDVKSLISNKCLLLSGRQFNFKIRTIIIFGALLEGFEKIRIDDVFVISVNPTRATVNEAIAFKKIAKEDIDSGHTKLVIDLSKCDYIDSTFFGAIIVFSRMLIDIGFKLKVVKPTIAGEFLFSNPNTDKLFDKYKTREEAILSFEEDIQP
jgi:anti-anti-sigma regulatory factor